MRRNKRKEMIVDFAPSARVPIDIVHRQAAGLEDVRIFSGLAESLSAYVLVLNAQRQIIFTSGNCTELFWDRRVIGLRPGEALGCIHVTEGPGGCGTSKACRRCGALASILASLSGNPAANQFICTRMIRCRQEILQFQVVTWPLTWNGEVLSLLVLTRGSAEDAQRIMERVASSVPVQLEKRARVGQ